MSLAATRFVPREFGCSYRWYGPVPPFTGGGGVCKMRDCLTHSVPSRSLLYEISHGCPQPTAARLVYMEFPKLETAALAHVDDSYYYGAYCRKCRHTARLSLVKLRAHLGDDFPLKDVRPRLGVSDV